MKKLSPFVFLFSVIILASSCARKQHLIDKTGQNSNSDTSSNAELSLLPLKADSWWLVKNQDDNIFRITATGEDTFMNGGLFAYFEMRDTASNDINALYYAKGSQYYLSLINLLAAAPIGGGNTQQLVPVIITTTQPKVGDTWETTSSLDIAIISGDIKIDGKVMATDKSMTVNGHQYKSVVETKNDIKAQLPTNDNYTSIGSLTIDFAPGIGIIKYKLELSLLNFINVNTTRSLIDYHISE